VSKVLSREQIEQYRAEGCVFPIRVMSEAQAMALRARLEEFERGSGFDAPPWSLRVSLANLPDEAYGKIGQQLRAVATEYTEAWQASRN